MKQITIEAPEGFEIDSYNANTGMVTFKPINKEKQWKDFGEVNGYYIDDSCAIYHYSRLFSYDGNKNTFPTKELAEASLALAQLLQWMYKVNDNWIPDWNDDTIKYVICKYKNELSTDSLCNYSCLFAFKSNSIRDQFLKDHKSLLEIAKPLL